MSTVGIIAEFNPFHNGHKYLIEQAKAITGADTCVIIMSGDFVQRGAPAICDKYMRTGFALDNGADIVFELPVCYSIGSAEAFADGAVRLLASTGAVDYLFFGSECGDINKIRHTAEILEKINHSEEFNSLISKGIKEGMSYPSARAVAVKELGYEGISDIISSPNNILAVEYCRALYRLENESALEGVKIPVPYTIQRKGQAYSDSETSISGSFASATAIRSILNDIGQTNDSGLSLQHTQADLAGVPLSSFVPENESQRLQEQYMKLLPVTENDFSSILYFRLNTASDEELLSIPDINPDLVKAIMRHRRETITISSLIERIKSKTFTYSAISRALFRIILFCGTKKAAESSFDNSAAQNTAIPDLRVLGFRRQASGILKQITDNGSCRLITTPSSIDRNNASMMQDVFAAELYNQILSDKFGYSSDSEFTRKIIMR